MGKELTIMKGVFSSFIGSDMKILERDTAEDSEKKEEFHVYGVSKQIIFTLIRFGVATSEQLYGLLVNLSKMRIPDKKKVLRSLRALYDNGYVEHIVVSNDNGRLDLYSPSKRSYEVCGASYAEYLSFAKSVLENCQEPVFNENLCSVLISNEFLKDTICTREYSHCKTYMPLETSYLKEDNPFKNSVYGSLSIQSANRGISIIKKLKSSPKIQIFAYPSMGSNSIFFNAGVYLNYVKAVEAYCKQKGIKRYLIIVIVPSVLQSYDFQEKINSNDKFEQKSTFYLEENSLFYGPMNNVFTLTGDSIRFMKF